MDNDGTTRHLSGRPVSRRRLGEATGGSRLGGSLALPSLSEFLDELKLLSCSAMVWQKWGKGARYRFLNLLCRRLPSRQGQSSWSALVWKPARRQAWKSALRWVVAYFGCDITLMAALA